MSNKGEKKSRTTILCVNWYLVQNFSKVLVNTLQSHIDCNQSNPMRNQRLKSKFLIKFNFVLKLFSQAEL